MRETGFLAGLGWRPLFDSDNAAYHRYFPRREGTITGEWSPDYMNMPGVLHHIRSCAPDARFLAILCDPVRRYRAGVERWRSVETQKGRRLNLWAGRKDAYARSFYGFMLQRYVQAFGSERLLGAAA